MAQAINHSEGIWKLVPVLVARESWQRQSNSLRLSLSVNLKCAQAAFECSLDGLQTSSPDAAVSKVSFRQRNVKESHWASSY